jgi:hypothetical protein
MNPEAPTVTVSGTNMKDPRVADMNEAVSVSFRMFSLLHILNMLMNASRFIIK